VEPDPKVMTTIDGEEWIIKFPAHVDGRNAGKMEYDYSCCAKQCGITMSETRLFPSDKCEGYFGTKRFDRVIDNGTQKSNSYVDCMPPFWNWILNSQVLITTV